MALLEVRDLKTYFETDDGIVKAVDGVSFSVEKGKTLGIVGESGSGKSVTCLTIMGLNARKHTITSGEAIFKGKNLIGMPLEPIARDSRKRHRDDLPGPDDVAEPGALDRDPVGRGDSAPSRRLDQECAKARAPELLKAVGIPRADRRIDDYPHQFSGGMRQRAMIAMALVNDPDLLIADEPTTALDVTTQAQIVNLMKRLQQEFGSAIIVITHDLGVVAETADDVLVMYAAEVAEQAPVRQALQPASSPLHVGSARFAPAARHRRRAPGADPGPAAVAPSGPRSGCRFHPRCAYVMEKCRQVDPELVRISTDPDAFAGVPSRRGDEGPRGCEAARGHDWGRHSKPRA